MTNGSPTGVPDLDKWAEHLGVPTRRIVSDDEPGFVDALTGKRMEPDEAYRARILTRLAAGAQSLAEPRVNHLHDRATYVVAAWRTARNLTMLSPEACSTLVELIYTELTEAAKR